MATYDLQEQEQIDTIKAFWARWGGWISGVITVALLAFIAYQGWNWWQRRQAAQAAQLYTVIEKAVAQNDWKQLKSAAEPIKAAYPSSAYAARAALLAARADVELGEFAAARSQLEWVTAHAKEAGLIAVSHLRLAELMLDAKQYEAALAQLAKAHDSAFDALFLSARGDVLSAQGDPKAAAAAYRDALAKMPPDSQNTVLVQMKLAAQGVNP